MKLSFILISLLFLVLGNVTVWREVLSSRFFTLAFLDVGQGDAILLKTPQGHSILIDGGRDKKVLTGVSSVLPFWDRSIDLMIPTHADNDHIGGLIDVFAAYNVKNVLWTGVENPSLTSKVWREALDNEGALAHIARAQQKVSWQKGSSNSLNILYPWEVEGKESNDTSIVAMLAFKGNSVLLTGDLTKKGEKELLSRYANIEADILKVGHHGSNSSTSQEFVAAVNPYIAVISAGEDNSYGHPHQNVIDILGLYGIQIRRTDQEGDLVIRFQI